MVAPPGSRHSSAVRSRRPLMRVRRLSVSIACSILFVIFLGQPAAAGDDVVTQWNVIAEAAAPRFGGPQQQSRFFAVVQIAVHDALNSIEPRYARYTGAGQAASGAS